LDSTRRYSNALDFIFNPFHLKQLWLNSARVDSGHIECEWVARLDMNQHRSSPIKPSHSKTKNRAVTLLFIFGRRDWI
jgi:hypothetical protein